MLGIGRLLWFGGHQVRRASRVQLHQRDSLVLGPLVSPVAVVLWLLFACEPWMLATVESYFHIRDSLPHSLVAIVPPYWLKYTLPNFREKTRWTANMVS